ncbi:MAG: RHS repeat-associated core domain-containing protein, partial [Candidatus Eisenbacteria sp.]|nr:RHS repeat-associated core domain-containing protein [Candidatus Eisenbacteria bacterium]
MSTSPGCNSDALGWSFSYDIAGRPSLLISPGGSETRFDYNTDTRQRVRETRRTDADGSQVTHVFDTFGRRVRMTDPQGETRYTYDSLGRLAKVERSGLPTLQYEYNNLGWPVRTLVGQDHEIRRSYDFLGRLEVLETAAGRIIFEYQTGQGKTIRRLPNGVWTVWETSADGRLSEIGHVDASNRVLLKFNYIYRVDGLIAQAIEWNRERGERRLEYAYDLAKRLVRVVDSTGPLHEYEYDQLSNRVRARLDGKHVSASECDWAGRLNRLNGRECSCDIDGNQTTVARESVQHRFGFGAGNRLLSVAGNGEEVAYLIDGDGQLIARTVGSRRISFTSEPFRHIWRPVQGDSSGGDSTLYVWEGDGLLATVKEGKASFFLHDHLGSSRCLLNETGRAMRYCDYDPYGVPLNQIDDDELSPGFAGLIWDPRAEIYFAGARAYDPRLGRFLQPDPRMKVPVGAPEGPISYVYCGGDPVNFSDRDGAERRHFSLAPERPQRPESGAGHDAVQDYLANMALYHAWEAEHSSSLLGRLAHHFGVWTTATQAAIHDIPQEILDDCKYYWTTPVRDTVVRQILRNALALGNNDFQEAQNSIRNWRNWTPDKDCRSYGDMFPDATPPTAAEIQGAGNYATARAISNVCPVIGQGVAAIAIPGWALAHFILENTPIPPSFFSGIQDEMAWVRQTVHTHWYSYKAILDSFLPWKPVVDPGKGDFLSGTNDQGEYDSEYLSSECAEDGESHKWGGVGGGPPPPPPPAAPPGGGGGGPAPPPPPAPAPGGGGGGAATAEV